MKTIFLNSLLPFSVIFISGIAASSVELALSKTLTQKNDRLQAEMRSEVDNILGLLGLNKIETPPFYSQELQEYRQSQADRTIAPFLGHWTREWELFPPYSSLSIFPSKIENHLCIIKEVYDYGEYYDSERRVRSARFEFVTLKRGRAIGSTFILDRDLIWLETNPLGEEKIEFLGTVSSQTDEFEGLYASSTLAANVLFDSAIQHQFEANHCLESLPIEGADAILVFSPKFDANGLVFGRTKSGIESCVEEVAASLGG